MPATWIETEFELDPVDRRENYLFQKTGEYCIFRALKSKCS